MDFNSLVNYTTSVQDFYQRVVMDKRLHSSHVSLICALLFIRYQANDAGEFVITRKQLMRLSRIGSIATYQKCIGELVKFGYIEYKPTFNSYIGTKVRLIFSSVIS